VLVVKSEIEGVIIMKRLVASAFTTVFFALAAIPAGHAQDKPLTPQQQKMKDCAGKWKDEKAKTGVKGREAYRTFMGSCMKS
jgi:hypothetical protein